MHFVKNSTIEVVQKEKEVSHLLSSSPSRQCLLSDIFYARTPTYGCGSHFCMHVEVYMRSTHKFNIVQYRTMHSF